MQVLQVALLRRSSDMPLTNSNDASVLRPGTLLAASCFGVIECKVIQNGISFNISNEQTEGPDLRQKLS
jgi:hypothetical protein